MRDRAVVEPQALFRLAEVSADNIGKLVEFDMQIRIERVDVVHSYLIPPAHHDVAAIPSELVGEVLGKTTVSLADGLMPDPGCRTRRLVLRNRLGAACFGKVGRRGHDANRSP